LHPAPALETTHRELWNPKVWQYRGRGQELIETT
jgi:hypothetical protein